MLSRSVWTILWEMMSRLKEKYMCVLFYACILQKLVGHWAMQIVIIDKHLVSEFREFYWTWVWRALTLQFAQAFWDCQFQWENSFQQITWQWLVQSLCNFGIKHIAHFGHFWPILAKMCFVLFRENFFVWGKILKPAEIDQHHQGHIWTKNSQWLTPITSNS